MELESFRYQLAEINSALQAWGNFVELELKKIAQASTVKPQFTSSRVKDIDSAVGKITRKKYKNPIADMTDLVGARIVVLLSPDLRKLMAGIEASAEWENTLARDPSTEKEINPERFDYESVHYEVRSLSDREVNGVLVPKGLCCEVQIRTLMQHAYAEVVHDNIYKSAWNVPSRAKRYVASSAALIDTADLLFCETMSLLETESKERGELLGQLTSFICSVLPVASGFDTKFNIEVLATYEAEIPEDPVSAIRRLLDEKPFILERIKSRLKRDPFWSQPVIFLTYWLALDCPDAIRSKWPYSASSDALELLFSDLGDSY